SCAPALPTLCGTAGSRLVAVRAPGRRVGRALCRAGDSCVGGLAGRLSGRILATGGANRETRRGESPSTWRGCEGCEGERRAEQVLKRKLPGLSARQVKQGGFTSGRRRVRRPLPGLAPGTRERLSPPNLLLRCSTQEIGDLTPRSTFKID